MLPSIAPLGRKDEDAVIGYWRFENRVLADAAAAKAAEEGGGMGRRRRRRRARRGRGDDSDDDDDGGGDSATARTAVKLPPAGREHATLPIHDLSPWGLHGAVVVALSDDAAARGVVKIPVMKRTHAITVEYFADAGCW